MRNETGEHGAGTIAKTTQTKVTVSIANMVGTCQTTINQGEVKKMTRDELKEQIDELMREYADEEIDGATYAQKMMKLTTSAQNDNDEE